MDTSPRALAAGCASAGAGHHPPYLRREYQKDYVELAKSEV